MIFNIEYCNLVVLYGDQYTIHAGDRTFGVLTKLDLMDKGTNAVDVIPSALYTYVYIMHNKIERYF